MAGVKSNKAFRSTIGTSEYLGRPNFNANRVLVVDRLTKHYVVKTGIFRKYVLKAIDNISFSIQKGKTLAVVGESGCGKSTLARLLVLIEKATSGRISVSGQQVRDKKDIAQLRRHVQMVFQNPLASLNPRRTIAQILIEPLKINTNLTEAECRERMIDFLHNVGLDAEHAYRYPHMFSGGQRQRIAIARAMILNPKIVVADEPVSALDVSIQAQIINLFMDLQHHFSTSYVFISHNLGVVEHIADDVMVMYLGGVVEFGDKKSIFLRPLHPYTKILMSATPAIFKQDRPKDQLIAFGEPPSPLISLPGCSFYSRCPYAIERCHLENPELRTIGLYRKVSCHRVEEIN